MHRCLHARHGVSHIFCRRSSTTTSTPLDASARHPWPQRHAWLGRRSAGIKAERPHTQSTPRAHEPSWLFTSRSKRPHACRNYYVVPCSNPWPMASTGSHEPHTHFEIPFLTHLHTYSRRLAFTGLFHYCWVVVSEERLNCARHCSRGNPHYRRS